MLSNNPHGIWAQIVAAAPAPEIDELAKIIGNRLIDTNESLWNELSALKEIVAEFLTFESGNMKLLRSKEIPSERRCHHKGEKYNNHKYQSDRCDDCESDNDSSLINSDETLGHIKDYLSVSKIYQVLSFVHDAFANERTELEAEIALLQTSMDTESEIISRGNTPRGDKIPEAFGSNGLNNDFLDDSSSLLTKKMNNESRKVVESNGCSAPRSVIIMGPGRIRRSDNNGARGVYSKSIVNEINMDNTSDPKHEQSHLTQSLNLKLSELSMAEGEAHGKNVIPLGTLLSDSRGPSYSRSNSGNGSRISRTRSRIETARDERFFMDDDIFVRR